MKYITARYAGGNYKSNNSLVMNLYVHLPERAIVSYDIRLVDPVTKKQLRADSKHDIQGGLRVIGGTAELWLNITWNYGHFYYDLIDAENGIRAIYGLSGAESIPVLQKAIDQLGDDVADDYWADTEGNAKRALIGLLAFAQLRPDGIWEGD